MVSAMDSKNHERVTYQVCSKEEPHRSENIDIDFGELQRNVLLILYYAKMMNMSIKATELLTHIGNLVWHDCYNNEQSKIVNHYSVFVPPFEVMRLMAKMYSDDLIAISDTGIESLVKLTDKGVKTCNGILKE